LDNQKKTINAQLILNQSIMMMNTDVKHTHNAINTIIVQHTIIVGLVLKLKELDSLNQDTAAKLQKMMEQQFSMVE